MTTPDIIITQELLEYIKSYSSQEPQLFKQLRKEIVQKALQPRMCSGAYQGRLLSMISKMICPTNILEIGTFAGYSALCLAEGLSSNGKIVTIDNSEEVEFLRNKYFEKCELGGRIKFLQGDASQIISTLKETFDLVFIDADKENYWTYLNLVFPKLTSGGIVLADNVLWSGKVLEDEQQMDPETKALHLFNKQLREDARFEVLMLPIRDGLTIVRKR